MLPTFLIYGLRQCATDSSDLSEDNYPDIHALNISDGRRSSSPVRDEDWADVTLEKKEEYDELIKEHPEAKLVYIDEDDGDQITVGSSEELYTRIEELKDQDKPVFDLHSKKGLPVWRKKLDMISRRHRQRSPDTSISTIIEGQLVDLTPEDAAPTVVGDPQEGMPFLAVFEDELSRLMRGASDLEAVGNVAADGREYTMCGAFPLSSPEVAPSSLPERAPTPPIELPAETPEATEDSRHSHPLAQFIAGFPARNQQLFTSLRSSVLTLAQTSASAARTAATLSRDLPVTEIQNGIETIRGLLDTAAREATAAAAQAAAATRSIDTSELQSFVGTVKNTVKEVGEAYQHVGQVVGGEVKRAVRDVVEGKDKTSERVSREEAEQERRELDRILREFMGGVAEPNGRKDGPSTKEKGKGKATEEPCKRAAPPRPFVEEVVDEEAPGYARMQRPFFTEVENVFCPPPVPPKVDSEALDIPHVQSPSPAHTSTPPPVPKKTPIDVSDDERKNVTIHAPEHDDDGDSDSSDDDDDDDDGDDDDEDDVVTGNFSTVNFSPRISHSSRMHSFTGHQNSNPSSPFGHAHYLQQINQPYNSYVTPCAQRTRDGAMRMGEARMFPRDDGFSMNGSNCDISRHGMTFPFPPFPPPPPHSAGPSMPHMSPPSFPGVRTSPPRMTPMPHQPPSPGLWGYMGLPPPRFGGESHLCPLFDHNHGGMPPFMASPPPPPPPPPPPFAPQPPYNDFFLNYPAPLPPPPSWMGDMGMYSRYMPPSGQQSPIPAQQAYNAAVKRALAGIPMPTLQDQVQNPQLSRIVWEEIERAASEVPVPPGAMGWAGMPFAEMFRLRTEASEEAMLRARRVGEEGVDHRDVRLEEEDEEDRNMNMPMENPFATPPRMESPAHVLHHSRPGSMQSSHMPTFQSSRPESAARIFPNFRPSPVPITPASPARLHSPFVRRDSPFVTRGQVSRQSSKSNRSMGMGNGMYGQHMSSPSAVPSDYGSARRSTPAIPVGAYPQPSIPAVPVDHRHMPSAPAVPGEDNDAFEMSSPLLPHLPTHRPPINPLLHNLHRGTPTVPEAPVEDNTHDEGGRQPQSPFIHMMHRPGFIPHHGPFGRTSPPPPAQSPVSREAWGPPISPMLRGLPRANTFPAAFPTQQSQQSQMPGSFPSHYSGLYRSPAEEMSMGSRNPFFHGHVPPAPFWPADVDFDDEDDEDDEDNDTAELNRGRAMGRQYSILTDDDDGFSFRSEEDRRGRSPTTRGPRAQPGNYTPPGPPRFKIDQHLRELAGERVGDEVKEREEYKEEQQHEAHKDENGQDGDDDDDDKTVQDEGEVQQHQSSERAEQPQPREQHEPSAPNTPVQQAYRLPGTFETQFDFIDHLERGFESHTLPEAEQSSPPHAEISVFVEAAVAAELEAEREEIATAPSSPPRRHPRNAALPDPPAPFSYPTSPSPPRTPRLDLRGFNIQREFNPTSSSTENDTQNQSATSSTPMQSVYSFPLPVTSPLLYGVAGPSSAESSSAALSLPPARRSSLDSRIDECMAQLIDMGYADDADGDSALDKLRVYARHADGNVQTAIELLTEDAEAYEEREREEAKVGQGSGGEGWRFAGWYPTI